MEIRAITDQLAQNVPVASVTRPHQDEVYCDVAVEHFRQACLYAHKKLRMPLMMMFASDRRASGNSYTVASVFMSVDARVWVYVRTCVPENAPRFPSIAKDIYSATLFEREIREMFGIEPEGSLDTRRLRLHDEVWPQGVYPLRKDFDPVGAVGKAGPVDGPKGKYAFTRVEGEGIFEVPVGPVHAGIIGPGHFRFSVAGEPIINLELRLGFTHRGVEKLFEGKTAAQALSLSECICGDAVFAYSAALCQAAEKIAGIQIPEQAAFTRVIGMELERMYNHAADFGGMAVDVGFTFPAMFAQVIKEKILRLNERLWSHRYLKGINVVGGVSRYPDAAQRQLLLEALEPIERDYAELKKMLLGSISFMDRVDTTGVVRKKTAEDFCITGVAGRASGIKIDIRKIFPAVYKDFRVRLCACESGDVRARLQVRFDEFEDSLSLVRQAVAKMKENGESAVKDYAFKEGAGLGVVEGWRGPVLFLLDVDGQGRIQRCKIVDASLRNWQGLSYAVLGNIIPDFPLCNKSFDLSYPGNDL